MSSQYGRRTEAYKSWDPFRSQSYLFDGGHNRVEDALHLRVLVNENQCVGDIVIPKMHHRGAHPLAHLHQHTSIIMHTKDNECELRLVSLSVRVPHDPWEATHRFLDLVKDGMHGTGHARSVLHTVQTLTRITAET